MEPIIISVATQQYKTPSQKRCGVDFCSANYKSTQDYCFFYKFDNTHNINLDFLAASAKIAPEAGIFLLWSVKTPNLSGKHQPILWCYPRSYIIFSDRGDGSHVQGKDLYPFPKTIMTVLGGFLNSPIANSKSDTIFHLSFSIFGDPNFWSFEAYRGSGPFGFMTIGDFVIVETNTHISFFFLLAFECRFESKEGRGGYYV